MQHLLDKLSRLLPNSTYRADGNYVADGLVKTIDRNTDKTNWPTKFLNALGTSMFVNVEGSKGRAQRALRRRCAQSFYCRSDGRQQQRPIA
jgi:hypothetical protein